jgi:MFS family permease
MRSYLERLDRAPWRRVHTWILISLGVGWALDSFEVNIVGNVLSLVKRLFHLSDLASSLLVSSWLVGILVGAWGFGYLADRLGRKRLIVLTIGLYAAATVATACAWNYPSLMAFRFLTALGVGAEYSVVNASIAEFVPAKARGWAGALVINFWSAGAMLGSAVTLVLLATLPPATAWRLTFAVGALGALAIALFRRHLPESPRWLMRQGRWREARAVVEQVTGEDPGPVTVSAPTPPAAAPLLAHRRALVFGALLATSLGAGYYGLFAAVPLILVPHLGLGAASVPVFFLVGNLGSLLGGLTMTALLDRWGRARTVGVFFTAAALSTLLLLTAVTGAPPALAAAAFLVNSFWMTGAWTSAYPVTAELLPTERRATGLGLAIAVGRLAAAVGPVLLVAAAKARPSAAVFILAGYWAIGAGTAAWWARAGVEAKARPLEEVAAELAEA